MRVKEIELQLQDVDLWKNSKNAELILKEMGGLQGLLDDIQLIKKRLNELSSKKEDLNEDELFSIERSVKKFEIKRLFGGRWDNHSAVISISAGAGGQDAADWAYMLFLMYQQYAQNQGWSVFVVDLVEDTFQSKTGRHPIKHITFDIVGQYAFGYLKNESGVHRLVRVSPFSTQQLRHTSFALVEVLPRIEETALVINESDLAVEFFRSSGPGGQNVNKVETAVRVVHNPTGLSASCQMERSQAQNREHALHILEAKLIQRMEKERVEELGKLKTNVKPEWGSQIRSYVLNPYKLVKDHRTGYETTRVEDVIERGELEELIEAELVNSG